MLWFTVIIMLAFPLATAKQNMRGAVRNIPAQNNRPTSGYTPLLPILSYVSPVPERNTVLLYYCAATRKREPTAGTFHAIWLRSRLSNQRVLFLQSRTGRLFGLYMPGFQAGNVHIFVVAAVSGSILYS